jgi:hypothetical protein
MKIRVFNLILTHDIKNNRTVILSTDNNKIVLPTFYIESPKTIHQEIRYLIKNLFDDPDLKYIELINVSFIEIQNELLINYIKDTQEYSYDENEDLCLFVGVILTEKNKTNLFWSPVGYSSVSNNNNLSTLQSSSSDILTDYVIKNIVL